MAMPSNRAAGLSLASEPSPALLALQPEIDAADQASETCYQLREAVEDAWFANAPRELEEPWGRVDELLKAVQTVSPVPLLANREAWDAYRRSKAAYCGYFEQAKGEAGLKAAQEAVEAADAVRLAIRRDEKIIPTRARSLDGLIFKAQYAVSHFPGNPDEDVMRSIVDDLCAMAGEVV